MPNWCDNRMRLSNDDSTKLDALEAELSKKNDEGRSMANPFQHLCPNPTGEWDYAWSCTNWGTKWDADMIDWDREDDNTIVIYCNTAWSPPIALYEYLTEEGWGVDAVYHESGMGFAGQFVDGFDDYYEYSVTDQGSIEDLPAEVQDFAGLEDAHQDWKENAINEYIEELERTEWYVGQLPARDGRYEITTEAWNFPQWCEFKDGKFQRWSGDDIKVNKWRGLAQEFTDKDYQDMLDNIAENN